MLSLDGTLSLDGDHYFVAGSSEIGQAHGNGISLPCRLVELRGIRSREQYLPVRKQNGRRTKVASDIPAIGRGWRERASGGIVEFRRWDVRSRRSDASDDEHLAAREQDGRMPGSGIRQVPTDSKNARRGVVQFRAWRTRARREISSGDQHPPVGKQGSSGAGTRRGHAAGRRKGARGRIVNLRATVPCTARNQHPAIGKQGSHVSGSRGGHRTGRGKCAGGLLQGATRCGGDYNDPANASD
jgi:hypothetical protein